MLPELERGVADEAGLARLRIALSPGPWCWPSEEMIPAIQLASAATGLQVPPEPQIGVVPGVTVEENCALLWLIDAREGQNNGDADLGDTCRQSWHAAALALPRAVPLLWTSVSAAHAHAPILRLLGSHFTGRGIAPTCRLVRGPSFGIAFLLVLASKVFRVPLPGDLVASGAITEDGRIEPIDGLELKLEAIIACLPRVRRLLVAADQQDAARAWASGRLDVIGIASASQALEVVFGNQLSDLLLKEGTDADRREELSAWFFRFCLQGRGELVDWSPIAAAAKRALEKWPDLTEDQRFQLAFAQGVAERHEWNGGTLPVPPLTWLLARPAALRTQLVAHLVQHLADVGNPAWNQLEALVAAARSPSIMDAHPMQLRLEGALARLWAVTGHPREALERQEQLARVYFDSMLYADVSFPLAEWYRLSGVAGDGAAFERAERMRAAVETVGGFGLHGSVYVELARCKALALLHPDRSASARATLSELAQDFRAPEHVRWSAARWALRIEANSCGEAAPSPLWAALEKAANTGDHQRRHAAAVNLALAHLDAAVAGRADSTAAVLRLKELEPGLTTHLLNAVGSESAAGFVATNYPY